MIEANKILIIEDCNYIDIYLLYKIRIWSKEQ